MTAPLRILASARRLFLAVGVVVFVLLGAARPAGADPADLRPGVLLLRVYRPGVVWLDATIVRDLSGRSERAPRAWDVVAAQSAEVPAGSYRLSLRGADDRSLGALDEVELVIAPGETTEVALGRPLLRSSPAGARVVIDQRPVGTTPLRLDPARLSGVPVSLELDGYQPWSLPGDSLLARTREAGALRVELEPAAGAGVRHGSGAPPRRYFGLRRTPAIAASVTLVAVGVTSAILLKSAADDRFDAYLGTGDPGRQRREFDRAQRYDRLSLVGWGVAEAAFFATFFLLIQEEPRGLVPTVSVARAPDGEAGIRVGVRHGF